MRRGRSDRERENPVKLSTGEKFKVEADFISLGLYGLSLQRTYRSMQAAGAMFGPYWLSNLEYPRLSYTFAGCVQTPQGNCVPRTVTFTESDGTKYVYTYDPSGSGTLSAPTLSSLAATGTTSTKGVPKVTAATAGFYAYTVNGAAATGDLIWVYGSR